MTRKDSFFITLILASPFAFLAGTLLSGQTFFSRDLTYLFHPWRTLSTGLLQAGEMPLWNAYEMGGMPFLANLQSSILYPFTSLFVHFDFVAGLKLFHLLHYGLAGLGFFLLSRKMKFSSWAAFAGSLVFAYNGYLLTRLEFPSVLGSLVWLPWALVFVRASLDKTDGSGAHFFYGTLCSAVFALSLFSGYAQIAIFQILTAFLFWLFLKPSPKDSVFWVLCGCVFLGLAAAQWLPTLELIPRSIRGGGGVALEEAVMYSLPPDGLLGLVYPFRMLHHPDRFSGEKFFWIWSAWWGITASVLVLASLGSGRKKETTFGWLLAATGIMWSLGSFLPPFEFLYHHFFLLKLFRYPPVALYWTVAGISFLVLAGAETLKKSLEGRFQKTGTLVLVLGIGILAAELAAYGRGLLPTLPASYFRLTFPGVRSLLEDKAGTVALSPKVDQNRRLEGMSTLEAKTRFRAYLFDLTNLPYRLRSIVVSGEPLALRSYDNLRQELMASRSLEEARPWLNLWNVTHFLSNDVLDATWEKIGEDKSLKVYRNLRALPAVFALKKEDQKSLSPQNPVAPSDLVFSNSKVSAVLEADESVLAHFVVPFYPGWRLYCSCSEHAGRLVPTFAINGYFTGAFLPAGRHPLTLVYQPWTWKAAVLSSILAVFLVFAGFILKSRRWLKSVPARLP